MGGGGRRQRVVEGNLRPGPDVDPRGAEPDRLAVALAPPAVIALEDAAAVGVQHLERGLEERAGDTVRQIIAFYYARMRNADAVQVYRRRLAVYLGITHARAAADISAFKAAYEAFEDIMRQLLGAVETKEMRPLDRERDGLLTDLSRVVNRSLESADAATLAAARHVKRVLNTYGKAADLRQNAETGIIGEILKDLGEPDM